MFLNDKNQYSQSCRVNEPKDFGRTPVEETNASEAGCRSSPYCYIHITCPAQSSKPAAYVLHTTGFGDCSEYTLP